MENTKLSSKPSALPGSRWNDTEFPEKVPIPSEHAFGKSSTDCIIFETNST